MASAAPRLRPIRFAVAATLVAVLAGCGWSARDEFLYSRSVRVSAGPGDGSPIAADLRSDVPTIERSMPELAGADDR